MAAKRGRTITSFGQTFAGLAGGQSAPVITGVITLNAMDRSFTLNTEERAGFVLWPYWVLEDNSGYWMLEAVSEDLWLQETSEVGQPLNARTRNFTLNAEARGG